MLPFVRWWEEEEKEGAEAEAEAEAEVKRRALGFISSRVAGTPVAGTKE